MLGLLERSKAKKNPETMKNFVEKYVDAAFVVEEALLAYRKRRPQ